MAVLGAGRRHEASSKKVSDNRQQMPSMTGRKVISSSPGRGRPGINASATSCSAPSSRSRCENHKISSPVSTKTHGHHAGITQPRKVLEIDLTGALCFFIKYIGCDEQTQTKVYGAVVLALMQTI